MLDRISTGIEGLDLLTGGGFLCGSAYIIQGPPGSGKTILANQFCYAHVKSGGRALYMSLLAESSARMREYISRLEFFRADVVPESMQYVSGYSVLKREGRDGLLKLVQHEIARQRATVMVLDGTFVAEDAGSEQEFRAFIHSLQSVAAVNNAVMLMLTHQGRPHGSPEHTMVDGWIEVSNQLKGFRTYRGIQVRKHRGANVLSGIHTYRITGEGVAVFPRFESIPVEVPGPASDDARIPSGLPELDRILEGGLPPASATLVLGPTGAGKTTLGMHFLSRANAEEPALMVGFYESPARLRVKAASIGLHLDELIDSQALHVIWTPPSEVLVDELLFEVLRKVRAIGAKRVFIDGLRALRHNLVHEARLPEVISALSLQLREMGVAVMYASETRELGMQRQRLESGDLAVEGCTRCAGTCLLGTHVDRVDDQPDFPIDRGYAGGLRA